MLDSEGFQPVPMNRRIFLQTSAATLAGLTVLPHAFGLQGQSPARPEKLRYDRSCFTLDERDLLLYGAEFHYCRCPQELWPDRFLKLQRAGFNFIQTMVFWNWHERTRGVFDFADFEAFVRMAADFGFFVSVRPGPYICAEWDRGGFPSWVVAEQFPLRGMDPRNLRWSKYWFDHALPVIGPLQVTQGGPIILFQIENEINFWHEPSQEKQAYLAYLAQLAGDAGIDVPLFTNLAQEARNNSDPVMARITDSIDSYPRWKVDSVAAPLAQLRREESHAPLGIAELQGGWFAQIGGKLSVQQDGVDGAQLGLLDRFVLARGVTWFSDYMGFGGTNFDWAGKDLTTSYDYAAPVREPGGLWEKYYEAHGVGQIIAHSGEVLARAEAMPSPTTSSTPLIDVLQRAHQDRSVLFLHNQAQQELPFHLQMQTGSAVFQVPLSGNLQLEPREMKALPVNFPLGNDPAAPRLLYTTAELAGAGPLGKRWYAVLEERPGRALEVAFTLPHEPRLQGEIANAAWDAQHHAMRLLLEATGDDQSFPIGDSLILVVTPRSRGLKTWRMALSHAAGEPAAILPWITDASLLRDAAQQGDQVWAEFDLAPGDHLLTVLTPLEPAKVTASGHPVDPVWNEATSTLRMRLIVPPPVIDALPIEDVKYWVEEIASAPGDWSRGPLLPLEKIGPVPYGWVKYRSTFSADATSRLQLETYTNHTSRVFINGQLLPELAAKPEKSKQLSLGALVKPGANEIEVVYDCFGAANFGPQLQDLSGLKSAAILFPGGRREMIEDWRHQVAPAPMRGRAVDPNYVFGAWQDGSIGALSQEFGEPLVPAFVWARTSFHLRAPGSEWSIAWRLHVECDRDALFYLNSRFVGRYASVGPQSDFYLPEPWLHRDGTENVLTIAIAGARRPDHIRVLRVEPYEEWAVRRTRIEMTMA